MSEPLPSVESGAAEPPSPAEPPSTPATSWWRRALPFVVAVAFVAFTLVRVDLRAFARHLASVNAAGFLVFSFVFVLALLTSDSFATAIVYRRTVAPVSFREFWVLRGASYLPSILNHHVGQAILTYYVSRRYGVSLARMAGGTLLVYVSWMGCLFGAFCVSMVVAGMPLLWPALAFLVGLSYLGLIALRPARLARIKLLAPLFEAGLGGHVLALAVRLPHFVVLFLGTWLPFYFFDVSIPPREALVYMPMLMVVVTLPIAPQGLGTRDTFGNLFLAQFAAGATVAEQRAAVAAATTSWAVAFTLIEVALGLFLLKRAMPALEAGRSDTSPAPAPGAAG
jgi:hypothetical protein